MRNRTVMNMLFGVVAMKPACSIHLSNRCYAAVPRFVESKSNHIPGSSSSCFDIGRNSRQFQVSGSRMMSCHHSIGSGDSNFGLLALKSDFGQSRVTTQLKFFGWSGGFDCREIRLAVVASSAVKTYSTTVETLVNDKNFERIYVQGGVNVKPLLVVERFGEDNSQGEGREGESGEEGNVDLKESESRSGCLNGAKAVKIKGGDSAIEKEGWKLLEKAVVTYCGSPVGTGCQ